MKEFEEQVEQELQGLVELKGLVELEELEGFEEMKEHILCSFWLFRDRIDHKYLECHSMGLSHNVIFGIFSSHLMNSKPECTSIGSNPTELRFSKHESRFHCILYNEIS